MKISKLTHARQYNTRRCKVFSFLPTLLEKEGKGVDTPPPLKSRSPSYVEFDDLRDRMRFPPRLFLGHSAKYWALWILGAATAAVWLGPLFAEFINRFLVKLW